jgi:hypothetical protein
LRGIAYNVCGFLTSMSLSATALGKSMWARILRDLAYLIRSMSEHQQRLSPFRLTAPRQLEPAVIGCNDDSSLSFPNKKI